MNDNKDENAKNPEVPMDLPNVKPADYDKSIDSGRGSAKDPAKEKQKELGQLPLHEEEIGGA